MSTRITGRRLHENGAPIDGTGFAYDEGGRIAELLAQRNSPLFSQPITGEWVFGLVASQETEGEYERGVGIFSPSNAGPPEHIHPTYDEHFEILKGEFIFRLNGEEQRASAGDKLTVAKGVAHTFRCVSESHGAVIVETRPAARTGEVIATLFGLAHEGKLTPAGQPKLMQAMVIASAFAEDTVFTNPPPAIALPMANMLAPIGRMMGYRLTYPEYADLAFWQSKVEQPD
jgi:quercetin dioxygenase-like cupin family protein